MEKHIGERNPVIDVLKGIGIISMVMGHSNMGSLFETYIAGFHMQLFFIISGYLYNPSRYSKFGVYAKRKVSTILVPYALFAVVTIIICEIINLCSPVRIYTVYQYVEGIIWSNQSIFPITGAIWFLQCIFWIEIGYYFIAKMKSLFKSTAIVLLILLISIIMSIYGVRLPFAIDSAVSGIVFYHIGHVLSNYIMKDTSKKFFRSGIITWIIVFCVNAILIIMNGSVNPRTCEFSNIPLYYINALVGTWVWLIFSKCLLDKNGKTIDFIKNKIKYIGVNSIVYLGLNQLIIKGLYVLLTLILPVELSYVRAGRNLLISLITLVLCGYIAKVINISPISWIIGKPQKKNKSVERSASGVTDCEM